MPPTPPDVPGHERRSGVGRAPLASRRRSERAAVNPAVPTVTVWPWADPLGQGHHPLGGDTDSFGEAPVVGDAEVVAVGEHLCPDLHAVGAARDDRPGEVDAGHEGIAARATRLPGWTTIVSLKLRAAHSTSMTTGSSPSSSSPQLG